MKAGNIEKYYKIPAEAKDLNYNVYFVIVGKDSYKIKKYNFYNTKQLNIELKNF
jgi:hypothetical protein